DLDPNCSPLVLPNANIFVPELAERESATNAEAMQSALATSNEMEGIAHLIRSAGSHEDSGAPVEKARAEAAEIIAEAHARVGEIERAAREKAIEEARSGIDAAVAVEIEPLRAQMAESLSYVADLREQMATYAEHELVQLAIEIARK